MKAITQTSVPFLVVSLLLSGCSPSPTPVPSLTPSREASTPAPATAPAPTRTSLPTPSSSPTLTPSSTLGISSSWTSPTDQMVLLYVPEGSFLMGSSNSDGMAYSDEKPQHAVSLDAFWVDQTEVTNYQYALCVQAKACRPPSLYSSNVHDHYYGYPQYADYPVIYVTWNDAQAYCQWAGARLPTEAEWEKAARGADGHLYPWGNDPPDDHLLNFNLTVKDVSKVGSYPGGASPYGALDMAGNVWEWVQDWYGMDYYSQSPSKDPTGPVSGQKRVLKGGSWTYTAAGVRAAYRFENEPTFSSPEIGIRCVRTSLP